MFEFGDAVAVAPDLHEVVFENDVSRILRVTVPVSAKAAMHTHPNNVNYVTQGGILRFTFPDGTVREVALLTGQTLPGDATTHAVENIGITEVQTIQIEYRSQLE